MKRRHYLSFIIVTLILMVAKFNVYATDDNSVIRVLIEDDFESSSYVDGVIPNIVNGISFSTDKGNEKIGYSENSVTTKTITASVNDKMKVLFEQPIEKGIFEISYDLYINGVADGNVYMQIANDKVAQEMQDLFTFKATSRSFSLGSVILKDSLGNEANVENIYGNDKVDSLTAKSTKINVKITLDLNSMKSNIKLTAPDSKEYFASNNISSDKIGKIFFDYGNRIYIDNFRIVEKCFSIIGAKQENDYIDVEFSDFIMSFTDTSNVVLKELYTSSNVNVISMETISATKIRIYFEGPLKAQTEYAIILPTNLTSQTGSTLENNLACFITNGSETCVSETVLFNDDFQSSDYVAGVAPTSTNGIWFTTDNGQSKLGYMLKAKDTAAETQAISAGTGDKLNIMFDTPMEKHIYEINYDLYINGVSDGMVYAMFAETQSAKNMQNTLVFNSSTRKFSLGSAPLKDLSGNEATVANVYGNDGVSSYTASNTKLKVKKVIDFTSGTPTITITLTSPSGTDYTATGTLNYNKVSKIFFDYGNRIYLDNVNIKSIKKSNDLGAYSVRLINHKGQAIIPSDNITTLSNKINIYFGTEMSLDELTNNITLYNGDDVVKYTGTISDDGLLFTMNLDQYLKGSSSYVLTVPYGVKDVLGNIITKSFCCRFTTMQGEIYVEKYFDEDNTLENLLLGDTVTLNCNVINTTGNTRKMVMSAVVLNDGLLSDYDFRDMTTSLENTYVNESITLTIGNTSDILIKGMFWDSFDTANSVFEYVELH